MGKRGVVVLYSGGTDSTLTAALMAEQFEKIYLVTYNRFGFFSISNTELNFQKLKSKFSKIEFTHQTIGIDKLSKYVFYEHYFRNLVKHRFFLLSTCGLCKLTMHIRTIVFCLENKIYNVCDGANKGMRLFPAQMKRVIEETKKMYAKFGISYMNPVFDFEGSQDLEFIDRLRLERVLPAQDEEEDDSGPDQKKMTAGCKLFDLGLMPSENIKGTKLDRKMQPRCFQFILFNIFILWYYMHKHTYEQYEETTFKFYKDKIDFFTNLLEEYTKKGQKSKIFKLVRAK